jgi:hypothetical protein
MPYKGKDVFHPFSLGPMGCIGKNLAYMEVRLLTSNIIRKFDVSLAPGEDGHQLLMETHDHVSPDPLSLPQLSHLDPSPVQFMLVEGLSCRTMSSHPPVVVCLSTCCAKILLTDFFCLQFTLGLKPLQVCFTPRKS